ncbi:MAG TPA: AI-2E family transporter [Candidatus Paceibacterota bacterium]
MNITINPASIFTAVLVVLLVALLFFLRDIVLVVVAGIVIASSIEPAVRFCMRYRLPRVISVLLVYAIIVLSLMGVVFFFLPPLLDELSLFLSTLPQTIASFNSSGTFATGLLQGGGVLSHISPGFVDSVRDALSTATGGAFTTLASVFGGLASFVLIIVFSFYFAVQETGVDDFLRVVTPVRHQGYVLGLWKRSQEKIGKWMQGQLVLGLIVGVLLYLGLVILGVPYAFLLAVLAAVFELIPVFGQILAAIPAIAVAYGSGGVGTASLVIGLYVIVQQFESSLIYPLVVKKVVGVPPLLVILALIIGAKLAGFLGVLLSVPIAAAIQEFIGDVEKRKEAVLAGEDKGA